MKIGIISDTHDQMEYIEKAIKIFNDNKACLVIHCGDWVSPFTLIPFKELKCPVKALFGNNDGDKFRHLDLAKKLGIDIFHEDRFLDLEIENKKIAVFHGDYIQIVRALAKSGMYDAVFYGHNHTLKIEKENNTLVVNPGGFTMIGDPSKKATIAVYDTDTNTAEHIYL